MDYSSYTTEDFVKDEKFIQWVKTRDESLETYWETWLQDHPEKKAAFLEAQNIVQSLDFSKDSLYAQDKAEMWQSIKGKTLDADSLIIRKKVVRMRWMAAVAAVLCLLVSAGGWQWYQRTEQVIMTSNGEQKEFILSDGTAVTLNANSSLKFVRNEPRKVWLKGEAYFEVSKKPRTGENFLVLTEDLTVRVLGTVFNVNCRNEATRVYLEEGKVNLELDKQTDQTVAMVPGDLVSYSSSNQALSKSQQVNALANTSWKEGTLIFRETPLEEVLEDLSEIYGVEFELVQDSLRQKLISGGVPIRNLSIALETLEGIYEIDIRQEDDRYIIGN